MFGDVVSWWSKFVRALSRGLLLVTCLLSGFQIPRVIVGIIVLAVVGVVVVVVVATALATIPATNDC